jgi:serine/threonine-protein kinase 19
VPLANEDADLILALPSDTETAVQILYRDFPRDPKIKTPPILLRSQIYSMIKEKTVADKELSILQSQGKIRLFQIPATINEYYAVMVNDYENLINYAKNEAETEKEKKLIDDFYNKVVKKHLDVLITKDKMIELMLDFVPGNNPTKISPTKQEKQKLDFSLLITLGFINNRDANTYWFGIPYFGSFWIECSKGRKEIIITIKRLQFKEILLETLEKRRLKNSVLGVPFHLSDMTGLEIIQKVDTTSGPLIKFAATFNPNEKKINPRTNSTTSSYV